jgi:hypothetical protein
MICVCATITARSPSTGLTAVLPIICAGAFKQTDGTGLGDGDTRGAADVSAQIETEDQILGAQQRDVQEAGGDDEDKGAEGEKGGERGRPEEQEGVEMQDDFEGEVGDAPENVDVGGDSDEVLASALLPSQACCCRVVYVGAHLGC